MSTESSMMDELQTLRARVELIEQERTQLRQERATLQRRVRNAAIGLAVALVSVSGVAVAADGLCPNDYPFCFTANQPAIASQVNHNFDQIKEWVEQKVGPTGTANVTLAGPTIAASIAATSISASGGVTAASLSSAGATTVGNLVSSGGILGYGDLSVPNNATTIAGITPGFSRANCNAGTTGAQCPSGQFVCGVYSNHTCGQNWYDAAWTVACCAL